jgi:hypothetical protein
MPPFARRTIVALSLVATVAFGGCTVQSTTPSAPTTLLPLLPLDSTTLYSWLSAGEAQQLRTTLIGVDPRKVRVAGIDTADLLHRTLDPEERRKFKVVCFSDSKPSEEKVDFGCPWLHLQFDPVAVASFEYFRGDAAADAMRESFAVGFDAFAERGGLGRPVASTAETTSIQDYRVWRSSSFRTVAVFPNERFDETARQLVWSADGSTLAIAYGGLIEVRTLATGTNKWIAPADDYRKDYSLVGLSPDASQVIGVSSSFVTVWDSQSGNEVFTKEFPYRNNVNSRLIFALMPAAWSPDGKWVITEAGLDTIVWDTATWTPRHTHPAASDAAWSTDSQRYVLAGIDDRAISEVIYETESTVFDAPPPTLHSEVFAVDGGRSEARIAAPFTSAQWATGAKGNRAYQATYSRVDPKTAFLWSPQGASTAPIFLSNAEAISGDGSIVINQGQGTLNNVVTGERVDADIVNSKNFTEFGVTDSAWSPDSHLLAQVTDTALYIYTDLPR